MSSQTSRKASRLIELGLHPVLLGSSGEYLKIPQLKAWQTAVYSPEDVATWPAGHNIGVRGGATRVDGRYLVIFDHDYDAARIYPEWAAAAEHIAGRPLVTVTSGKGFHTYFYTTSEKCSTTFAGRRVTNTEGKSAILKFIETRGARGQVVTPGSQHPSGKVYQFAGRATYADIPTLSEGQYQDIVALSERYDERPKNQRAAVSGRAIAGTGELATVPDCLAYAYHFMNAETRKERNGDVRLLGHGGLIITGNGRGWYCHSEETGGGLADLIAWDRKIPLEHAMAMLHTGRPEETDPAPERRPATDWRHGAISGRIGELEIILGGLEAGETGWLDMAEEYVRLKEAIV